MNEPWYLTRAAGMVAYLLIFVTVTLGIAVRTKGLDKMVARWRVTDIHRFLSILCVFFVAVHVVVLLWDGFVGYSVTQVLVPFASPYRPFWTSLGIVSMYLLVLISISFALRRYTGYRFWRILHYATYALFVGVLAHAMFTGTDSTTWWAQLMYVVTAGTVFGLVVYRLQVWQRTELRATGTALLRNLASLNARVGLNSREAAVERRIVRIAAEVRESRARSRVKVFAFAASAALGILLIGAAAGPFKWFESGSSQPNNQQVQAVAQGAASQAQPSSGQGDSNQGSDNEQKTSGNSDDNEGEHSQGSESSSASFTDSFTGTLQTRPATNNSQNVQIVLDGSGGRAVHLAIALTLQQDSNGNVTALSNSAVLTDPSTGANICSGTVQELDSGGFSVQCTQGTSMMLQGQFTSASGNGSIAGTLQSSRSRHHDD